MEKILCTKCGKNIVAEDGTVAAAYSFNTAMDEGVSIGDVLFMKAQMGKYKNLKEINICFECLWDVILAKNVSVKFP